MIINFINTFISATPFHYTVDVMSKGKIISAPSSQLKALLGA